MEQIKKYLDENYKNDIKKTVQTVQVYEKYKNHKINKK